MRILTFIRNLTFSILLVAFATGLALLAEPVIGQNSLFILLASIVISALYADLWTAGLAAALAALSHNFFHQIPRHTISVASMQDLIELLIFWLTAFVVSVFGNRLQAAREKALDAARSREELLAIVSHDLKNPLNVIKTNAGLLAQTSASKQEALVKKSSGLIQQAAGRMERLIQDLLDYEKMKGGRLELDLRPVDVRQLLEAIVNAAIPLANTKGIQVSSELVGRSFLLGCDIDRMLQAFSNLVGNAVKFSRRGTRVTIRAARSGTEGLLSITDQGPGITKEQLPHVFDRYWQAKQTSHMGQGLGLSIVKGIVDTHGGRVEVESVPGKGTTFRIILPILENAKAAA